MSDLRKAAQQALEVMEGDYRHALRDEAIDAISAALAQPDESFCDSHCTWHDHHPDCALAQPEQEPVAWWDGKESVVFTHDEIYTPNWTDYWTQPLYTAPPQRKPLTDDEIELAYREIWRDLSDGFSHTSAEWIEAGIRYAEKVHGIE